MMPKKKGSGKRTSPRNAKNQAAQMNRAMKDLNEELQAGTFRRLYLFYGSESYLSRQYADTVRRALIPADDQFNFSHFDGDSADEKAIMQLADTTPFFSDRRVILVEDSGWFTTSHEDIAGYFERIPETTTLIFLETNADARMKTTKAAKKAGLVIQFVQQDEKTLFKWAAGRIRSAGKTIDSRDLEYFISIENPDMNSMQNELSKLISYTGSRELIERSDIDAICSVRLENKVFDMINAVAAGSSRRALRLYDDLITLREPPVRILFNIRALFSRLYEYRTMNESGYTVQDIAATTGTYHVYVGRDLDLSRRFSLNVLRQALEDCISLEEDFKSGRISDRLALETFITRYSTM